MKKLSGPIPEEVLGKISVSVSIVSNAFTCNSLSFTCKEFLILLNLKTCNFAKLISHSSVSTCKLYVYVLFSYYRPCVDSPKNSIFQKSVVLSTCMHDL